MKRDLSSFVLADLETKLVLVSGPRQCGKTTMAKSLFSDYDYFNYDHVSDRLLLKREAWRRDCPLVIMDEIHKMDSWKRWLKGIYDTAGIPPRLLVTGSAKLDTYKKVGDSLAGRFFQYQLFPVDFKEALSLFDEKEAFRRLWECGGFPEPFLKGEKRFYDRWRRSHVDVILREDLIDLATIRDIKKIELLIELLARRVGSTVSYSSLARDLECDANTVKRWLELLENLYIIFRVTPYHRNVARAILKDSKYYFYDYARIDFPGSQGAKLENMVALFLYKELCFLRDTQGVQGALHFLRTKEGKELDFLVVRNQEPDALFEVKYSDSNLSSAFAFFENKLLVPSRIQLVLECDREKSYPNGVQVRSLRSWMRTGLM